MTMTNLFRPQISSHKNPRTFIKSPGIVFRGFKKCKKDLGLNLRFPYLVSLYQFRRHDLFSIAQAQ